MRDALRPEKLLFASRSWVWLAALVATGFFFYATRAILLPFMAGALIAYFLNPLTTMLAKKGGRTFGALQSLLLFFAFFIVAFLGAIPFIKAEFLELSRRLPFYLEKIYLYLQPWLQELSSPLGQEQLASLEQSIPQNFSSVFAWGLRFLAGIFSSTLAVANLLSLLVITPIVAFYFLRDWPLILNSLDQLLPRKVAPVMRDLFSKINSVLGGYARGQLTVCLILAFYYAAALKIVGLEYAITIGLIAGFFAFIPYFGFLIGIVAAFGMALSQFDSWTMFALIGAIFLLGQLVESYILLPKLIGNRVGLHPVWILFALLAGGILLGFFGLLIAMPVAAALGVIVRFVIGAYKKSDYAVRPGEPSLDDKAPSRQGKEVPHSLISPSSKDSKEDPDD